MRIAFFDAREHDRRAFAPYDGQNGLTLRFYETKLCEDTAELAGECDAVCVFVNDSVNGAVIERLYALGVRLIALRCAGYNNVDLRAAYGKIHVVRVPAYSPYAVAEHAMALLLCSVRRIHKAYDRTRDFNFSLRGLTGFELHGKTAGVVGTGRIGRVFIELCRGFGMDILAYDKFPADIDGVRYVPLEELLEKSDVISLHCPLTEETYHLIDRDTIGLMKPTAVIVNTSRGALINAEELLEALKERRLGAACLDVYEEESDLFFEDLSGRIVDDDTIARLMTMPNVIVTSHQAFLTEEALANIAETTVKNILDFFGDETLTNEVCYRCEELESCRVNGKKRCF